MKISINVCQYVSGWVDVEVFIVNHKTVFHNTFSSHLFANQIGAYQFTIHNYK